MAIDFLVVPDIDPIQDSLKVSPFLNVSQLDAIVAAVKGVPWTVLEDLKGNDDILKKLEETEITIKSLRKTLSNL